MKRSFDTVYEIKFDDGLYYRGLHSTNNINDNYAGSGRALNEHKDINPNFTKTVVKVFDNREEASEYEKEYIADLWKTDPNCLNMKPGGDDSGFNYCALGVKRSEESRAKMSKSQTARKPFSKEHRAKISATMTGSKQTKEHIENARQGQIGKTITEEQKKKISKTLKGRKVEQVKCPHCCKVGGKPIMHRYHFDKCRNKI